MAAAIQSGTGSDVTDFVALDAKNIAITAVVAGVDAMRSRVSAPPAAGLRCARLGEDVPRPCEPSD